ncbi:MAG: hypothetical protein KU38_00930 [Sulfurovum sp. FS08-3]|nr:MAG: hypothetical protein KU38_00930 [Sulfurovum sp. FS08-3]
MKSISQNRPKRSALNSLVLWCFIVLYPIIASIYAFSPPLLGIAAFVLIDSIEKGERESLFMVLVYMLNIDVNFSMPMFLSIFSTLLIYTLIFPKLSVFNHCKLCVALIVVAIFNLLYLEMILLYSYIFQEFILDLDGLLFAYFVFDLLMVFAL